MRKANVGEAAIPRRPTVCGQLSLSAPHTHRRLEVVCWLALERLEPGEDATLSLQPCLGIFFTLLRCSPSSLSSRYHAVLCSVNERWGSDFGSTCHCASRAQAWYEDA